MWPMDNKREGFVLIAVLVLVMLLAVVLLEFSFESRVNLHASENYLRSQQALWCAEAGINLAIAALGWDEYTASNEALLELFPPNTPFPVGEGECIIAIREENGLLNVNMLKEEGALNVRRVNQLLRFIDLLNAQRPKDIKPISYEIVPSIIDWVDEDEEVTILPFVEQNNEGAEQPYYDSLLTPYKCKNAPVDILDELLLVKGVNKEILYEPIKMRDYLTIYGNGRVDINHAPALVLQSLSEKMERALADAVIMERKDRPFRSMTDLQRVRGLQDVFAPDVMRMIAFIPEKRYFQVVAQGKVGEFTQTVRAIVGQEGGETFVFLREEL